MKATVWTSWSAGATVEPKCIFEGDISFPPRIDDYIVLREGFGSERVTSVTHDFTTGEIEITVAGSDPDNEYGRCLFASKQ